MNMKKSSIKTISKMKALTIIKRNKENTLIQ